MKFFYVVLAVLMCTTASAQINKAALISVFGDRNLSDNPLDTKIYEALMKDSSFNLLPIVNKFDITIQEKFLPEFPFPFVLKEEVVNAEGYTELKALTRWSGDSWYTTPADQYVSISAFALAEDSEAIKKSFEIIPSDVDAVLIAYVNFNIYDAGGIGPLAKKKIYAYVNLKMYDREGKRIFKLTERATSDDGVMAVSGFITDLSQLTPMIESAADNLMKDMESKLNKSLNKMAKKLK